MHSPKAPTIAAPAPAPPPPGIDQALQAQQNHDLLRKRQGAASTILAAGGQAPQTGGASTLLGT